MGWRIDEYRTPTVRLEIVLTVTVTGGDGVAHAPVVEPARSLRIADAGDIDAAVEAWLSVLKGRGKKASTIGAYRQTVRRAVKIKGWNRVADFTFENIVGYLGEQREAAKWRGTTYTRNLVCFRSLTDFLRRTKRLPDDPLVDAEGAKDDGGDGARAATTEEARLFIRTAWIRQETDGRCKGNRALIWACLFLAGCRAGEPERWKRQHVILDETPPRIRWTKEIQKNGRLQEVALAPELAELLRRHLATEDAERRAAGLPPAGPDDPMFRFAPPRPTFRRDRDRAGIAAKDRRGRGFSAHSARKWHKSVLTAAGVGFDMTEYLMRHAVSVAGRYYDPSPAEQAAALATLPALWAERLDNGGDRNLVKKSLDFRADADTFKERDPDDSHLQQLLGQIRGPHDGSVGVTSTEPFRPADSIEQPESPAGASSGPHAALIRGLSDPKMPRGGSNKAGSNHVADLLEALAGLIRAESGRATGQRTGRGKAG